MTIFSTKLNVPSSALHFGHFFGISSISKVAPHLSHFHGISFNRDVLLKILTIDKPVVIRFSFDGFSVNQELYSKDYNWQSENLRKIFKAYYEKGIPAGFMIYAWASDLDTAYVEKHYAYTASNKVIAQAVVDIASTLGPRNAPTTPLQFVKLSSK